MKFFIKSLVDAKMAKKFGLVGYGSRELRSLLYGTTYHQRGYILSTPMTKRELKKAGLLVSNVFKYF